MTAQEQKKPTLDASSHIAIVETSARYEGWRIVVVCFLVATFGWGFGFYGQSVYLAELHRQYGWPASLISSGTTFFYLFGAVIVAFVSEAVRAVGPRNCLLGGVVALAAAAVMMGQVTAPWQLYLADAPSASRIRAQAFRDVAFLSVSIAFALVLFAQVGFIVHLISFLDQVVGRERAAVAVALLTAMAVVGRVLFSFVIDRLNQRLASALSFVSQAVALTIIINVYNDIALIGACALFGFSVGNLITLPSLIVQREFDPRSFGVLVSLITAVNQITYAFGPGGIGLLRDASGSYALPFYVCIGLELTAAVLITIRAAAADPRDPAAS